MQLGGRYRDKITGLTGIVTGYVQYLTGCHQALLQPQSKDGEYKESRWFDVQRLERVDDSVITLDNSGATGFDRPAPKR